MKWLPGFIEEINGIRQIAMAFVWTVFDRCPAHGKKPVIPGEADKAELQLSGKPVCPDCLEEAKEKRRHAQ